MASRKTVPPNIFLIVPFGDFHIFFKLNSKIMKIMKYITKEGKLSVLTKKYYNCVSNCHFLICGTLFVDLQCTKSKSFLCQRHTGQHLSPFQVALDHTTTNVVKATAVGWSTGSSTFLTFRLHSHTSSTRQEGSGYQSKSLWYDPARARTHGLSDVRQML